MHNLENIIEFIEKSHKIKLFDYQKKMLQMMIDGKIFSSPVRSGRRTLLKGYTEYLNKTYGKQVPFNESEEHITYEDVMKESNVYEDFLLKAGESNVPQYVREYQSEWK